MLLKIIQHCNEALPQLVTGQLLGLDVGQQLEVTDCFAFPVRRGCDLCRHLRAVQGGNAASSRSMRTHMMDRAET